MAKRYWLMKSEPDAFSFDDLVGQEKGFEPWDGVRNYQARNFMREMSIGDRVLFYHSRTKPPHVVGIAEVTREAYPDHTAFDPEAKYYDPKSNPDEPRWFMVDLKAVEALPQIVSLGDLKANPKLAGMVVTQKGSRLSVQPVESEHYDEVLKMGGHA